MQLTKKTIEKQGERRHFLLTNKRFLGYLKATFQNFLLHHAVLCPKNVQRGAPTAHEEGGTMTRLNRFTRIFLILLAVAVCLPAAAGSQTQAPEPQAAAPGAPQTAAAPAAEQPGSYTIKEKDTLWDISSAQYRDPFLWPLIWQANPSINDPDLIYPGTVLVIPSLAPVERAISAPQEAAAEKSAPAAAAPSGEAAAPPAASLFSQRTVESTAPEAPAPVAGSHLIAQQEGPAPLVDKYLMISGGFVSDEDSKDIVLGSVDDTMPGFRGKNIHATGQEVYLKISSRPQVNIGERFLVYTYTERDKPKVYHPRTGKLYGKLYKVNGIAKVKAVHADGVYTADIPLSFDTVIKGDMLVPYQEPELIYPAKQKRQKDLTGYLIDVSDRPSVTGQLHVVYLDKGKTDGVEPGDRFDVYEGETNESGVPKYLGDVLVFIVKERTATAVVRNSISEMKRGDRVMYEK
jgi:LysM repeat protein